jgi:hypothetical protein
MSNKRFEVQLMAKHYIKSKNFLRQVESGYKICDIRSVQSHQKIVGHIEETVESLSEYNKFIIQNEVIEGRTGNWFRGYLSRSTYFRNREKAYEEFLRCL